MDDEGQADPLVLSRRRKGGELTQRKCQRYGTLARACTVVGLLVVVTLLVQPGRRLLSAAYPPSALGLAECEDTPGWTNGMKDCKVQQGGQDPTLCTETGWTCKGYEARGLCGDGQPKGYAMGPGLNSPEKNCCACKGFKRQGSCNRDTGGTCFFTQHCNGWRGAAQCRGGRCECDPGYCSTSGGTCQLDSRSSFMQRSDSNMSLEDTAPTCSRVTSGTCILPTMVCEDYRGPTTCSAGQCTCLPGYCTDLAGMCFKAMGIVHAMVVPVSRAGQRFPGLARGSASAGHGGYASTALCVSGGGPRAMSAALGHFRALHHLGLLPKVDLLSSVSGGSWASAILNFADMDLETMLGPASQPSLLTLAALDATPPPFGAVLMNKTTDIGLELRRHSVPYRMLWVETVGKAFLDPFKLYDLEAFMAPTEEAVQKIIAKNPQYQGSRFQVPKPGRVKNLVMGGTLLTPDGFKASSEVAMSVQMGPDFTGVPFYPKNSTVEYAPTNLLNTPLEHVLVGGGFVESFAWGGPAPPKRAGQKGGEDVELFAPASPFSLTKAVGVSSAAFAGFATQLIGLGENLNPQANVWPVTSPWHPRPQQALPYQLGDGGNTENTGVIAALQRGATRIAAMIQTDTPLDSNTNFCAPQSGLDLHGKVTQQLAILFGLLGSSDSKEFLENNQVFPTENLLPLLCQLQRAKYEGRALVARQQLVVQANAWWGLAGGGTVDIAFFYLESAYGFQDLLPSETQNAMKSPSSGLSGFPNFKTCFQNFPDLTRYTARQINLVSALTEWAVLQNAQMLQELFS